MLPDLAEVAPRGRGSGVYSKPRIPGRDETWIREKITHVEGRTAHDVLETIFCWNADCLVCAGVRTAG